MPIILWLLTSLSLPLQADMLTVNEWIDLGWDYFNAGDIDQAFNTFIQAVDQYPESADVHLALGEMYFEMGSVERGRNAILTSLSLDDESPIAARAHYQYALSIREEDTWQALLHLDRAHHLDSTPALQFEIGHQIRFCHILLQMTERSVSGPLVFHYANYLLSQDDGDSLSQQAEESLYRVESFCYFDLTEPVHFFLYPSERAVRAEIRLEEDEWDPEHREFHIPYTPNMNLLGPMSTQVVSDLQDEMNRHAGSEWVIYGLPLAVTGVVNWEVQDGTSHVIDVDDVVRALVTEGALIDLEYLISENFNEYIPESIGNNEIGSLLRWVRRTYPEDKFQELLTQPNLELVLDADLINIQSQWLGNLASSPSLLADPELAAQWVAVQPISPLSGDPELPLNLLKEGLRLYLSGSAASGLWEIRRALELDPGLAVGYYTLGWIAYNDGDWEETEEHLGLALQLFENPEEIAWCHVMLAPIYLNDCRWDLAHASLSRVAGYTDSENTRQWATELLARVGHILALRPVPLDRDSVEFGLMRTFFQEWNRKANSDEGVYPLINGMMDDFRTESIANFYLSVRNHYPMVVFNHAVQEVGLSGSAILAEAHVQAVFPDSHPRLPADLDPLVEDGYSLFFQVIPTDDGWMVLDWEDGSFPLDRIRHMVPGDIGINISGQE